MKRPKRSLNLVAKGLHLLIGAAIGHALNIAQDKIVNGVKEAQANECKFSITHVGGLYHHGDGPLKLLKGEIHSEWEIEDGDINTNDEKLDGRGLQTDLTRERMNSAAYLKVVRFRAITAPTLPTGLRAQGSCLVGIA